MDVGYCWERFKTSFLETKLIPLGHLWGDIRHREVLSSLTFVGCTVRFAWYYNGRSLIFAPRNRRRGHLFTCCTNRLSNTINCARGAGGTSEYAEGPAQLEAATAVGHKRVFRRPDASSWPQRPLGPRNKAPQSYIDRYIDRPSFLFARCQTMADHTTLSSRTSRHVAVHTKNTDAV